jgi:hypothetical protein
LKMSYVLSTCMVTLASIIDLVAAKQAGFYLRDLFPLHPITISRDYLFRNYLNELIQEYCRSSLTPGSAVIARADFL